MLRRLLAVVRRRRLDETLDEEVGAHLAHLTADFEAQGMSPDEARRAARRAFGGLEQMKEAHRDQRALPMLETIVQDVRYAARALSRQRSFATVAVTSLALGIGAATAVFSLVNAVMLRPLVAEDPEDLVVLSLQRSDQPFPLFNPEFDELRARQRTLTGLFAVSEQPYLRVEFPAEAPTYVAASLVSGAYFDVLGISPQAGRLLSPTDDDLSAAGGTGPCTAVISDALWRRRFGHRPDAIGRTFRVRERTCAIVGIAPAGFRGHRADASPDIWLPLRPLTERRLLDSQTMAFYSGVMGRLRPGLTRSQAEGELTAIYRQIQALEPPLPAQARPGPKPSEMRMQVDDGSTGLRGVRRQYGRSLLLMLGAVTVVVLIASSNVASVLLARGVSRDLEISTRIAMGAGCWRIVRQLATEGSVLAVTGGVLGVLLAAAVTPRLARVLSPGSLDVSLDYRVLLAAAASTMLATLVVGLVPAVRLGWRSPQGIGPGDRSTDTRGSQRVQRMLLVAQFALSLLLVTVAGLLLRTSVGLSEVDLGFDSGNVVMLEVADETPGAGFNTTESAEVKAHRAARYRAVEDRLNALPGVAAASLSWLGLFTMQDLWLPLVDPRQPESRQEGRVDYVSSQYFDVAGMRVVRGRAFTDADAAGAPRVAVVNETLVRERFGSREPLGSQLALDYPGEREPFTIVGVVRDSRYNDLRETQTGAMMWMPLAQAPFRVTSIGLRVTPGAEPSVLREAVAALQVTDPYLMVRRSTTLAERVEATVARERILFNVSWAFGLFALSLAAIGLHGTLAYRTVMRRREFGIRLALGAQRLTVAGTLLREALALVGLAAIIGVPLALAAGSLLRAFLFGVTPQDPVTIAAAGAVLVVSVLLAACVPALRASRIDPATALRSE